MDKKLIETMYDDIYEKLDLDHSKILAMLSDKEQHSFTIEEKEKLGRMELAVQTAKDIMENIMSPGTSMKIMHARGSLTIEINQEST
ncbi:hypothetical protein LRR81_12395 [Metabacillus sp. GX 13764]|uniref:hypothetical protein n=1 Tax=Metabacillus kandeliae TaxID=2900151 RepID=UPI001E2E4F71|nr:hypothetical protein [Metabacillus kandeliae]MCD7035048.1 hypothetical protein [Metabacillus kandeliae]